MSRQSRMFATADLPLFSGTPQHVRPQTFAPAPTVRQSTMAACPVCLDTGEIRADGTKAVYCTCAAGVSLRHDRNEQQEEEEETEAQNLRRLIRERRWL